MGQPLYIFFDDSKIFKSFVRKQVMRDLTAVGMTFVALAVIVMIGGAMVSLTSSTVTSIVGANDTLVPTVYTDLQEAITTFTSLLPLVALAVIGGLALFYVLGFLGGPRK